MGPKNKKKKRINKKKAKIRKKEEKKRKKEKNQIHQKTASFLLRFRCCAGSFKSLRSLIFFFLFSISAARVPHVFFSVSAARWNNVFYPFFKFFLNSLKQLNPKNPWVLFFF